MLSLRRPRRPSQTRRRAARLRGPAPARACCRSAAPRCRRRWSTGCRRSGSCLPTASDSGNRKPGVARGVLRRGERQPASTVIVAFCASIARTRCIRDSETTISLPVVARARAAAQARCCRPAARSPMPDAAAMRTTAATSSVEAGRTTAARCPDNSRASRRCRGQVRGVGQHLRRLDAGPQRRNDRCGFFIHGAA